MKKEEILNSKRKYITCLFTKNAARTIGEEMAIFMRDEYMSLIADGADQSAYGLPHMIELDKFSSGRRKIPVYLMGVLVHGYRAFGFTYLKNIKHGANIVIECLHQVFMNYKENRGYIPPVIFVQLDNTSKQNKNKYILGYLACLVAWGVCRQVILSFLPVGHTHEDIGTYPFCCFVCLTCKHCLQHLTCYA